MNFEYFNNEIKKQFVNMCKTGKLFRVDITGQSLWDTYLASFKDEKIFRDPESSEHNCNCCKNFVRRYGNIVSINSEGNLESIFSNIGDVGEYTTSVQTINVLIKTKKIINVFFETYNELNINLNYEACNKTQPSYKLGIESNFKKYNKEEVDKFGVVNITDVYTFNHFCIDLPKQFVDFSGKSIEAIMAHYRDKYSVFKRTMEEIPLDTLNLVKDLINQGSLLDGTAHLHAVEQMIPFAEAKLLGYSNNDYWDATYLLDERIAKFKNTLIGVLCTELAEGMELNKACLNWNKRVDPINYHKATAPITQKQIEEAKRFVEENDYVESFTRRLATIDDIKVSEILHSNVNDGTVKSISIFDGIKSTSTQHKKSKFDKVEEISIDKFMSDILPTCTSIEAYLNNNMEGNLCVLTTTDAAYESKPIFKWGNNYSWTFNGNLAGKSQIKENVKSVGGDVSGIVRCSLQWNDEDTKGIVDFDLHSRGKNHIYYNNNGSTHSCGGKLDTDMINPTKIGIENIFWKNKIDDGIYNFEVLNYNSKSNLGFKVEIEFNDQTFNYSKLGNIKGVTKIATLTVKNGKFTIKHLLPEINSSKEYWGLETNNFHKVNLVCLSPNHWGDNNFGNLHYMFMLEGCKTTTPVRGFHNENLIPDLLTHKKVMEVLGTTNMIEPTDNQLSGIGFNSTVKDELIVKCKGSHNRMLKIKF